MIKKKVPVNRAMTAAQIRATAIEPPEGGPDKDLRAWQARAFRGPKKSPQGLVVPKAEP